MGRKPIGKTAMTDKERQQRRRDKLAAEKSAGWKPGYRRGWSNRWMTEERFEELLGHWLEYGDEEQVAKYLADNILGDIGRWERIAQRVTELQAEAEAEAIEMGRFREEWLNANPDNDPLDCPLYRSPLS